LLQLVNILLRLKKYSFSIRESLGGGLHSRLVPYDLLTDKEKQKDLKFYQDLVKYINICGYRIVK